VSGNDVLSLLTFYSGPVDPHHVGLSGKNTADGSEAMVHSCKQRSQTRVGSPGLQCGFWPLASFSPDKQVERLTHVEQANARFVPFSEWAQWQENPVAGKAIRRSEEGMTARTVRLLRLRPSVRRMLCRRLGLESILSVPHAPSQDHEWCPPRERFNQSDVGRVIILVDQAQRLATLA